MQCDRDPAPQNDEKRQHHERAADQSQLFADNGEHKVVVSGGQEVHLLLAGHQPLPRQASGGDGDLRLLDLIAGAKRIAFGMEKSRNPLEPIRFGHHGNGQRENNDCTAHHEIARFQTRHPQHDSGDHQQQHRCP